MVLLHMLVCMYTALWTQQTWTCNHDQHVGRLVRHMKVALHALEHLNTIAWQQTPGSVSEQRDSHGGLSHCGSDVVPKPAGMARLERGLTLPDQLDGVTQPLLPSTLDQVTAN